MSHKIEITLKGKEYASLARRGEGVGADFPPLGVISYDKFGKNFIKVPSYVKAFKPLGTFCSIMQLIRSYKPTE